MKKVIETDRQFRQIRQNGRQNKFLGSIRGIKSENKSIIITFTPIEGCHAAEIRS